MRQNFTMRPELWDHLFCNGHITTGTSQINLQFYKETKEKSVETLRFNALWCVGWPVLLAVYSFSFSASCPAATSRSKSLWYRRSCKMRYSAWTGTMILLAAASALTVSIPREGWQSMRILFSKSLGQSHSEIMYLCHGTIGISSLYFYPLQVFSILIKHRKIHRRGHSLPYRGRRCRRK